MNDLDKAFKYNHLSIKQRIRKYLEDFSFLTKSRVLDTLTKLRCITNINSISSYSESFHDSTIKTIPTNNTFNIFTDVLIIIHHNKTRYVHTDYYKRGNKIVADFSTEKVEYTLNASILDFRIIVGDKTYNPRSMPTIKAYFHHDCSPHDPYYNPLGVFETKTYDFSRLFHMGTTRVLSETEAFDEKILAVYHEHIVQTYSHWLDNFKLHDFEERS